MSGVQRDDPLQRMAVYRLADQLMAEVRDDARILDRNRITCLIAPQLYRSVGSIGANIAEGYSRSSGRDRSHFFEYGLGSTRESLHWYRAGEGLIHADTLLARRDMLTEIRRLLLYIIPRERGRRISRE